MLILSWNINSIKVRILQLQQLVRSYNPDIILLQETKCITDNFPRPELEDMGYNIATVGQKSYNGVAILSKYPLEDITEELDFEDWRTEARYIEAGTKVGDFYYRIASVYVPNGQKVDSDVFKYKLKFLQGLKERLIGMLKHKERYIIGGDFNVAPENIDVYDPKYLSGKVCFHMDERNNFRSILNNGYYDSFRSLYPSKQAFSWWDYRSNGWKYNRGMRIDHMILSPQACDALIDAGIYDETRGWERPSDHAPVFCKFG